jgi:hypothetical protein
MGEPEKPKATPDLDLELNLPFIEFALGCSDQRRLVEVVDTYSALSSRFGAT